MQPLTFYWKEEIRLESRQYFGSCRNIVAMRVVRFERLTLSYFTESTGVQLA